MGWLRALHRPNNNLHFAILALSKRLAFSSSARVAGQKPPKEFHEKYDWIENVENLERYDNGGFHPVTIGDVINKRYRVVDKLGYGGYSTVWMTRDMQQDTYRFLDAAPRTPANSTALVGLDAIPRVLDAFTVRGPNGEHPSYTTAIAGTNLRDACDLSMFRLEVARALAVKLVSAIAYMHSRGYAHGDELSVEQLYQKYGHPETVPVSRVDGGTLPPSIPSKAVRAVNLGKKAEEISLDETDLLLIDFGESFAPKSSTRPCEDCRSHLAARPPESHFEPLSPLSFPADIWCLGLAIWNLFAIRPLFAAAFSPPAAIIAQHVDALGPLPSDWWSRWEERGDYFDENGNSIQGQYGGPTLNKAFDDWLHKNRLEFEVGSFSEEEKTAFLQLLRRMLSYDPLKRPTADEVLKSGWIANWAMDDFEKSCRMSHDSSDRPANMLSVAEYQSKYDEISEIRLAAKKDFSMSNAKKREISQQFKAARDDLRAASKAAMASSRAPPKTSNEASGPNS
ncbi:protein kinase domain protein [Beauveria bassiana ARSEF 2860]|uniref:non-specific serine/threonine protein kinase n=1 Tax=Beauveria bassiana (strain ARSEF 2860) TaxID=655819 RepID=J5JMH1_BEAB2|nr:protein kinase domain protein [Beauveria bassiana ARSEF 2860]EJP66483.1 protein kinase domain protein [Beauveria bassiana ARSEF 2860]